MKDLDVTHEEYIELKNAGIVNKYMFRHNEINFPPWAVYLIRCLKSENCCEEYRKAMLQLGKDHPTNKDTLERYYPDLILDVLGEI